MKMTKNNRDAFYRDWCFRTGQALGALLAETIGMPPSTDDGVRELVNDAIALEQALSTFLPTDLEHEARRMDMQRKPKIR